MFISQQQDILEIKQAVGCFVAFISAGQLHFLQHIEYQLLRSEVAASVTIGVGMGINVAHHGCREILVLRFTEGPQGLNIVRRQAIGVHTQIAWVCIFNLKHEMRKLHGLHISAAAPIVCPDLPLVITRKVTQDAQHVVVIDDRCGRRNKTFIEQEARTKAVNIADEEIVGSHAEPLSHPFLHATCSPIGERKTQHVGESHPRGMGTCHTFGQYLRFSATRSG